MHEAPVGDLFDAFATHAPETFCPYPFTYVNFGHAGRIDPCCSSLHGKSGADFSDPWNGELFRSVRRDLLSGVKNPGCVNCWKHEKQNVVSLRKDAYLPTRFRDQFNELTRYDFETGALENGPSRIKICLSNLCNLQCRMCNPEFSSRWEQSLAKSPRLLAWLREKGYAEEQYERPSPGLEGYSDFIVASVRKWAPSLRQIEFLGGEPFIQPEHVRVLDAVEGHESKIRLNYSSNFTRIEAGLDSLIERWRKFEYVEVIVSLDGVGELNDYVRWGSNYEQIVRNVGHLWSRIDRQTRIMPFGYATYSVYNAPQACEIAREFTRLGLHMIAGMVTYPKFLSARVLPPHERKRIASDIEKFLADLERNLAPDFDRHMLWSLPGRREYQLSAVRRRLEDFRQFLVTEVDDQKDLFGDFAEFDARFNEASGQRKSIFDFYPEWRIL